MSDLVISQREFCGQADLRAMMGLARDCRTDCLHVVDLPYRLCSWALDDPDNVALWVNAQGQLMAWAVMQTPFWTIDYVCHPHVDPSLHRRVLDWADQRARQLLATEYGRPMWFVMVFAEQAERIRDLEQAGFASQAHVGEDSWSTVLLRRPAGEPLAACALPEGFTIRPLAGAGEVEAYVQLHRAAFETRNMIVECRGRTLHCPEYVAELDCVAVAPDGRLAGFCIGWLDTTAQRPRGQIEPLGVHPDFRRRGVGRALLAEVLSRLYRRGAVEVDVEGDRGREAAYALYQSAGFRVVRQVLVYRKDYQTT